MNIVFVLSIIFLMILFLLYKKNDDKICFLSSFIYMLGLLFCYNTFIVYLVYLLGINGSMLVYSIINFIVDIIILILIVRKKKIQEYYFDKKKLCLVLSIFLIVMLVGMFRFRGGNAISYESGDSAIHYRHALKFSQQLSILESSNSQDYVFKHFIRVMPISYVNCGFLFNIFSGVKLYKIFNYYNIFCMILSSLIFLITIVDILKKQKKKYIYSIVLTLLYIMAFPFNSFVMGYCYLGLNIMVVNLLYLTFMYVKNSLDKSIIFKFIIIFLLTFSIFYSYYLFVPVVYLTLGLYYISLWRNNKISFKLCVLYGLITLIIPFSMGFYYFLITWFSDSGIKVISNIIGNWGYCYDNITPLYLFFIVSSYFIYRFIKKKDKGSKNYSRVSILIMSLYIFLFLVLYIFEISDAYYFYKLFSLYWLLIAIYFADKIFKYRKILYIICGVFLFVNILVYGNYDSKFSMIMEKTNIYSYNVRTLVDEKILFNKEEAEIMEESIKYQDECMNKDNYKFLVYGDVLKNIWFYSVTDAVAVLGNVKGNSHNLYLDLVPSVDYWDKNLSNYQCLIYYYEDNGDDFNRTKYDILYSNKSGAIIKRK